MKLQNLHKNMVLVLKSKIHQCPVFKFVFQYIQRLDSKKS